jgi:hypothetical protein
MFPVNFVTYVPGCTRLILRVNAHSLWTLQSRHDVAQVVTVSPTKVLRTVPNPNETSRCTRTLLTRQCP